MSTAIESQKQWTWPCPNRTFIYKTRQCFGFDLSMIPQKMLLLWTWPQLFPEATHSQSHPLNSFSFLPVVIVCTSTLLFPEIFKRTISPPPIPFLGVHFEGNQTSQDTATQGRITPSQLLFTPEWPWTVTFPLCASFPPAKWALSQNLL